MPRDIVFGLRELTETPTRSSFAQPPDVRLSLMSCFSNASTADSGYIPIALGAPISLSKKLRNATSKLMRKSAHLDRGSFVESNGRNMPDLLVVPGDEAHEPHFIKSQTALQAPPKVAPFGSHQEKPLTPKSVADAFCCFCEESIYHLLDNERPLVMACSDVAHYECLAQLVDVLKIDPKNKTSAFPECPNCGECCRPADDFYVDEIINDRLCSYNGVNRHHHFAERLAGHYSSIPKHPEAMARKQSYGNIPPPLQLSTITEHDNRMAMREPVPRTPHQVPGLTYAGQSPESATNTPKSYRSNSSGSLSFTAATCYSPDHPYGSNPYDLPSFEQPSLSQISQMPFSERRRHRTYSTSSSSGSGNSYGFGGSISANMTPTSIGFR